MYLSHDELNIYQQRIKIKAYWSEKMQDLCSQADGFRSIERHTFFTVAYGRICVPGLLSEPLEATQTSAKRNEKIISVRSVSSRLKSLKST
jgi:hypothetical protein